MHGGVNDAIGYIPGSTDLPIVVGTWIDKLKEFKDNELLEFDKDEVNNDVNVCLNSDIRKAKDLIDLGVPGGNDGHTVI